jgi:hypothetical protein
MEYVKECVNFMKYDRNYVCGEVAGAPIFCSYDPIE